jgi:predicted phosphoadenosine phosphosulfate sulfurtransferase
MKNKILRYVASWEKRGYPEGIPDEAPLELEALNKVPSYRLICWAIMKNDVHLQTLGYSRPKCEAYMALKKVEIEERNRVKAV